MFDENTCRASNQNVKAPPDGGGRGYNPFGQAKTNLNCKTLWFPRKKVGRNVKKNNFGENRNPHPPPPWAANPS